MHQSHQAYLLLLSSSPYLTSCRSPTRMELQGHVKKYLILFYQILRENKKFIFDSNPPLREKKIYCYIFLSFQKVTLLVTYTIITDMRKLMKNRCAIYSAYLI